MNRTCTIPLINPGFIADEYWLVHHVPNDQEWDIREIEIFWDAKYTELKSDNIVFAELPASVQTAILVELNSWHDEKLKRVHGIRRLLADIEGDARRGAHRELRVVEMPVSSA